MNRVLIESPFAGNVETNVRYARACVRDCLKRGESPIASHLLYTQEGILNDGDPDERKLGINAGLEWLIVANKSVVYVDLGISLGMSEGIKRARELGVQVEYRTLEKTRTNKIEVERLNEVKILKKAALFKEPVEFECVKYMVVSYEQVTDTRFIFELMKV
jgi:hypothetical protein